MNQANELTHYFCSRRARSKRNDSNAIERFDRRYAQSRARQLWQHSAERNARPRRHSTTIHIADSRLESTPATRAAPQHTSETRLGYRSQFTRYTPKHPSKPEPELASRRSTPSDAALASAFCSHYHSRSRRHQLAAAPVSPSRFSSYGRFAG